MIDGGGACVCQCDDGCSSEGGVTFVGESRIEADGASSSLAVSE